MISSNVLQQRLAILCCERHIEPGGDGEEAVHPLRQCQLPLSLLLRLLQLLRMRAHLLARLRLCLVHELARLLARLLVHAPRRRLLPVSLLLRLLQMLRMRLRLLARLRLRLRTRLCLRRALFVVCPHGFDYC